MYLHQYQFSTSTGHLDNGPLNARYQALSSLAKVQVELKEVNDGWMDGFLQFFGGVDMMKPSDGDHDLWKNVNQIFLGVVSSILYF